MNVNGIGSLSPLGGSATAPSSELGKDQFLELLLVQMQNQSPLDPMDSQQFLAQLAQFSTLEQLANVNTGLDNLAIGQAGMVAGQVVTMIGKDVTYQGNQVQLQNGRADLKFELEGRAESVRISIRNEEGTVVRIIEAGAHPSGMNELTWDGESDAGTAMPPGTYTFEIEATSTSGDEVAATTFSAGRVDGVTYINGTPELIIGDVRKSPADIDQITEPKENDES